MLRSLLHTFDRLSHTVDIRYNAEVVHIVLRD